MIKQRHPAVANQILQELAHHQEGILCGCSVKCKRGIDSGRILGSNMVTSGCRVATTRTTVEDHQIGMTGDGWQQTATDAVHTHLVETFVRPRLCATEQAMLRSQGGPLSGVPFGCFPTSALSRFDPSQFRVLMLVRSLCSYASLCACLRVSQSGCVSLVESPWFCLHQYLLTSVRVRLFLLVSCLCARTCLCAHLRTYALSRFHTHTCGMLNDDHVFLCRNNKSKTLNCIG